MRSISLCALLLAASPALAQTSVPPQLAYEGRLAAVDGGGLLSGPYTIGFAIWSSATDGTALWSEPSLTVTVVNGLYSVTLGLTDGGAFPPTVFDGTVRYLEVTVDGDTLAPRQPIGSVPYSILSGGVQGGPVNATSYALNGNPFANSAGRTLLSYTDGDGGTLTKSVAGLFCGASPGSSPYTGKITDSLTGVGGYLGTKLICQGICKSPTAHMCNGQELVSSQELGLNVQTAASGLWYSSGGWGETSTAQLTDCRGWTAEDSSAVGLIWGGGYPGGGTCTLSYPIACCD